MAKESSFPDFDEFDGWLKRIQPGRNTLVVRYRKGGDGQDYAIPGSEVSTPLGGYFQAGASRWSGIAAASGGFGVALPHAFNSAPVVIATPTYTQPLFTGVYVLASPQAYQIELYWWAASAISELHVHWLAFGPGAV
jgi:hypothetical protein